MHEEAGGIASGRQIDTDICIIGAGPAGITIAHELNGTGIHICLLESGRLDVTRSAQRPNQGESVGYPLHKLHLSRVRAYGGTSNAWSDYGGWNARPLDPIDFIVRPGIPYSGWPFGRSHLDPYYERAHAMCDLGPYSYKPAEWSDGLTTPVLKLVEGNVENTMFQRALPWTFTRTYSEFIRSRNVNVLLNARALELQTAPMSRRVTSISVRRQDGSTFIVRPRHVVLAAGGIENPRLLLLADDARGLGNDHDLVGRFFAERLSARTGELISAVPDLPRRIDFYELHDVRGIQAQGALRVVDEVQRQRRLLNCVFFPLARPSGISTEAVRSAATLVKSRRRRPMVDNVAGHLKNIGNGVGDLVNYSWAKLASKSQAIVVRAQQEQAPNRESRITLGAGRDDAGQLVARVDWRPTASDRTSMIESQRLIDGSLQASGLGHIVHVLADERPCILFEGNYHHMGTTRMHVDPKMGVVDSDCRVHASANVYVAGSSVFPTYGSSNPTLTIVALAIRLAEHLRRQYDA